MVSLHVLSPAAEVETRDKIHIAKRVSDLNGHTIGLYDNSKAGGDIVQERIAQQLSARFPTITFSRYTGSIGGRGTLNTAGAQAIAKECDAVIGIRGD